MKFLPRSRYAYPQKETSFFWRSLALVYAKDTRSEWRSPFAFLSTLLFAVILAAVYNYALEPALFRKARNFEAMLLASLFFSATLSNLASFRSETETGASRIMNMSFLDPIGIYFAKFLVHWQRQLLFIVLCVPIYSFFLLGSLDLNGEPYLPLLFCLALSALSLAALGVLLSYLSLERIFKASLMPLLLLPAAIPVLLFALNFLDKARQSSLQDIALIHYLLLMAPAGLYAGLGSLLYAQLSFEES